MPSQPYDAAHVAAVRGFNRFYTRQLGILDRGYLESEFSLAEARVLYELCYGRPRRARRSSPRTSTWTPAT